MAIEFGKGHRRIGVGLLPGRKSHCLYTVDEGLMTTVAYFRSEADSNHFLRTLAEVFDINLGDTNTREVKEGDYADTDPPQLAAG